MKPETAWNAAAVGALAACVEAFVFYLYFPVRTGKLAPSLPVGVSDVALDRARQTSDSAQEVIDRKEWTQDPKALSGIVLSQLSAAAEKRKVQVTDLRFDKPVLVGGVNEAPFTVMAEGDFDHVMEFVHSLESSDSKLGLSMLQITSSDQGPGTVKATLRLTAFVRGEV